MLITKIKEPDEITDYVARKPFIFTCFGCQEVSFPEKEVAQVLTENKDKIIAHSRVDYLCREEFSRIYIDNHADEIKESDIVIVFSCGVGVQVIAKLLEDKTVMAGCDTVYLNGFQGLTAQDYDCQQCGECYLTYTGGICPLTSCSKGLLNGPCGGTNDGKCEVNPKMNCGWDLIYTRLKAVGKENLIKESDVFVRDYEKIIKPKPEKEEQTK